MLNINDFTTNTPVLELRRAMHDIRANLEASFEDQLFIALLAGVQGKGSEESSVYLAELIAISSHTKKCLIDPSLVESLSKKGFLSAIRKNRAFWSDVLQGHILKIESEGKLNDMKAKLNMHNKTLLELCMTRLQTEKDENTEKLVQAEKQAKLKEETKAKREADKKQADAKKAQEEYQAELEAQAKQLQVVEEQVQAKLELVEQYHVEDAVQKALTHQASVHAQEVQKLEQKIEAYRTVDGIKHLIDMLDDADRQALLTALATKYPKTTTAPKRGKAEADQQATLIS